MPRPILELDMDSCMAFSDHRYVSDNFTFTYPPINSDDSPIIPSSLGILDATHDQPADAKHMDPNPSTVQQRLPVGKPHSGTGVTLEVSSHESQNDTPCRTINMEEYS
ncbi:hypothetical protein MRB53_016770 [Persea americana]|uniref:Uncharacterized protein n=1 Tax=Persea americana TaxID=3435 RepID=A0ACC2M2T1_PERAE|nr:hypothetical protein MRB53_016770 [Persea americana]